MKSKNQHIDRILKAIADPTRREIFHALVVASIAMPITQISEQFDISRQGVTKHIKTLEQAGLIRINTQGRERFCLADPSPLREVNKWLNFYEVYWDKALDNLEKHLGGKA
ncbi:MAG: metalloregulator ArsR/SmtB family transcription factor [Cyclobacteriaceae bacterium]